MPLKIRISNLSKEVRIDKKTVKKIAAFVLRKNKMRNALVDITFVSNRRIRALNKMYMGRDRATDVLSFTLEEKSIWRRKKLIGDVYISSDMARKNAGRFKTNFRNEIFLYVIHGSLHLLGFGDKTAKEKRKMQKLEQKFFKQIVKR